METNTNTGSYITMASLIVAVLTHYGFIISQSEAVTVVAGLFGLYGIIHQWYITKKAVTAGRAAGAVI